MPPTTRWAETPSPRRPVSRKAPRSRCRGPAAGRLADGRGLCRYFDLIRPRARWRRRVPAASPPHWLSERDDLDRGGRGIERARGAADRGPVGHTEAVEERLRAFYTQHGITTVSIVRRRRSYPAGATSQSSASDAHDLVADAAVIDADTIDALFIPCTALRTLDANDPLERALGVPVVTAIQATLWAVMRRAGLDVTRPGVGTLFRLAAPSRSTPMTTLSADIDRLLALGRALDREALAARTMRYLERWTPPGMSGRSPSWSPPTSPRLAWRSSSMRSSTPRRASSRASRAGARADDPMARTHGRDRHRARAAARGDDPSPRRLGHERRGRREGHEPRAPARGRAAGARLDPHDLSRPPRGRRQRATHQADRARHRGRCGHDRRARQWARARDREPRTRLLGDRDRT